MLTRLQIQDIGMGWYQWQLFIVVGFGWASDNAFPIVTSLVLTPIVNEFSAPRPPLFTLAQNIGLLVGAMFWGFGCDIFGRKWAFNLTLGVTAVFALIAASSPNFAAAGTFAALWSFGVGGNLPLLVVVWGLQTVWRGSVGETGRITGLKVSGGLVLEIGQIG